MKDFARLFYNLDQTNKTNPKVEYLTAYFQEASTKYILWTLAVFMGKRPKRPVKTPLLRQWCADEAEIPLWLFEESYYVVGDLAESIALLLPEKQKESDYTLTDWVHFMQWLVNQREEVKASSIKDAWRCFAYQELFVFTKLITGGYRIGVSQRLMVRALSQVAKLPTTELAHKLMGYWHPDEVSFEELFYSNESQADISRPYPFFLAHQINDKTDEMGSPAEWHAEWKWDGIRSQIVHRKDQLFIWSRGEELVTDQYPELKVLTGQLPDGCVLDGELLPFQDGKVLPFNVLQRRLGRKNVSKKLLEEAPIVFMAYDIMEFDGADIRDWPISERRKVLKQIIQKVHNQVLRFSPEVPFEDWETLAQYREQALAYSAEGLMLKRLSSTYQVSRAKGDWWKWKVDPFTIDAIMIYAQRGHGRRANLYSDYTFAVWNEDQTSLIPFTKAYSGLSDQELREVDRWVKRNTRERYGPVRAVKPYWVFELAFEGIQRSNRHKSGIALRFPRIHRWRKDLGIDDADHLEHLYDLLNRYFGE
jgi:DNA ligase-1